MNRIQRIEKQEEAMDATMSTLSELDLALEKAEKNFKKIEKFANYYGSEDWFRDYDAKGEGKVPEDVKCGVLSEDIPYDVILNLRDSSLKMLDLASKLLKLI